MPRKGRGRRVAARQAQLGQKKKHGRGPSGIPTTEPRGTSPGPAAVASATAAAEPKTALYKPRAVPARYTQPSGQPLVYNYVGPELRRIALLSSAIIIVIVALSFVLT